MLQVTMSSVIDPMIPTILILITNLESAVLFYSWNFDTQSDWSIINEGRGVEWVTDCFGNDLEGGPCVHLEGNAVVSHLIPTTGYHSIRIQIDIVEDGLDENDWCYIGYRTSMTHWTDIDLVTEKDDIVLDTGFNVTNSDDYNNQSSFKLRLGNSGEWSSDDCYFDTLQVFGIAYTPSPTDMPTKSPSDQPSDQPSTTPSMTPTIISNSPSIAPSQSPSISPTQPTSTPSTSPLTASPSNAPTEIPTIISLSPTFNPSKRPSDTPTLSPNDDTEVIEPTSSPSIASKSDAVPVSAANANGEIGNETLLIVIAFVAGVVVTICIMIGVIVIWKRKGKDDSDIRDKTTDSLRVSSIASISSADSGDFNEGFAGSGNGASMHVQTTAMSMNEEIDSSDNEIMYEQNNVTTKGIDVESNDGISSHEVELMNIDKDMNGFHVRCLADYIASDEDQLEFEEGQILYILRIVDSGWWFGIDDKDNDGWIPSNYVERIDKTEENRQRSDSAYVYGDNYTTNLQKYLNYSLPAEIVPILVTNMASDSDDEFSKDSDKMTTNGMTTKGKEDKNSSDSDNDKMYDRNNGIVTKNGVEDVIDEDDEIHKEINTTK